MANPAMMAIRDHGRFSEMMAIMCLAKDEKDFHDRVERIIVAYDQRR
jgi:formyltetrahydrofolate synthetase